MNGQMAGILSGLGVGLTAGVILAAMNPILPRSDQTEAVVAAPATTPLADASGDGLTGGNAPVTVGEADVTAPTHVPTLETPSLAEAEPKAPEPPARASSARVATRVGGLQSAPQDNADLAMVTPERDAVVGAARAGAEPSVTAPDNAPALDTATADPLRVPEPEANTEAPDQTGLSDTEVAALSDTTAPRDPLVKPEGGDAPALPGAGGFDTTPVIAAPAEPAPKAPVADTDVAETPQPEPKADPAPEVHEAAPAIKLGQSGPRTQGTIKTLGSGSGSRFQTVGDGAGQLAALGGSSRLPTIGGGTAGGGDATAETPAVTNGLERNRQPFTPADKPLMSLVLIDDGAVLERLEALKGTGLPLAIAIPVDTEDAGARARTYRDAGFEVLAMAPRDVKLSLSGNQSAAQVQALVDEFFKMVPDALGLIDRPGATIQKDQRLARYVVDAVADSGHGLVTYGGGLNAVPRLAAQRNVAAGSVYRFLDASGEHGPVIERYLNRAALEARSKGAVIVMATPSTQTLQEFLTWSLSSKARAIAMAPVSASLLTGKQ